MSTAIRSSARAEGALSHPVCGSKFVTPSGLSRGLTLPPPAPILCYLPGFPSSSGDEKPAA